MKNDGEKDESKIDPEPLLVDEDNSLSVFPSIGDSPNSEDNSVPAESKEDNHEQLSKGALLMKSSNLLLPYTLFTIIDSSDAIISGLLLSSLGGDELSSGSIISSVQAFAIALGTGIVDSVAIVVGEAAGAKNPRLAGTAYQQACLLGLGNTALVILPLVLVGPLIKALGQPEEVIGPTEDFFRAYVISLPIYTVAVVSQKFAMNVHKPYLVTGVATLSQGLMLLSSYGLALGKFGLPRLGTAGIGCGYIVKATANVLVLSACFKFSKYFQSYQLTQRRERPEWLPVLKKLWKIGWPMTTQSSAQLFILLVNSILMGTLGTNNLSAAQIASQNTFYPLILVAALTPTCTTFISQTYGAKRYIDMKNMGNSALLTSGVIGVLTLTLFASIPKPLTSIYIDVNDPANAEIVSTAKDLLIISGISVTADALQKVAGGILAGMEDTKFIMGVRLANLLIFGLLISYVAGFSLDFGIEGIAAAQAIGLTTTSAMLLYRWNSKSNSYAPAKPEEDKETCRSRVTQLGKNFTKLFSSSNTQESDPLLNSVNARPKPNYQQLESKSITPRR
jgi:multidrug resistance protein, MATE family